MLHRTRSAAAVLVHFLTEGAVLPSDARLALTTAGEQSGGSARRTDPAESDGSLGRERGRGASGTASRSTAAAPVVLHAEQAQWLTALTGARPLPLKRSLDAQMREAADEGNVSKPAASRWCSAVALGFHQAAQRISRGMIKCSSRLNS